MGPIEKITREIGWRIALSTLAANIRIGAGLCRAHCLGWQVASYTGANVDTFVWSPGCQRPAPGWEG